MPPLTLRRAPRVFATILGVAALLRSTTLHGAPSETLRAGLAKADITPTEPVMLAGYASRKTPSQGVHDPLSARAVAFEQGGRRLLVIAIDSIGFYGGTAEPLRRAILDATQLEPAALLLAATHDHSAPALALEPGRGHPNNLAYTQALRGKLATLARDAFARLEPVRLTIGSGSSPVGVNRREPMRDASGNTKIKLGRNPAKLTDREVQVVKIARDDGGALIGALFAYATHSTAMGPRSNEVSGDVHGLAAQFVERHMGEPVIAPAFAGASADIDPWFRVLPEFNTKSGWIPEAVLMGTMLGEEVVHVIGRAAPPRDQGHTVRALSRVVELPAKPRAGVSAPPQSAALPFAVTVARIGNVALVGLGGEVGNEIGAAIKAASPFALTLVITHCNGGAGYLVPEHYYPEGGYEPETSPFAATAAAQLTNAVGQLLRELHTSS